MCIMDHTNCSAEQDLKQIKYSIEKIETALLGSEYHPNGLIDQVKDIKSRIDVLEKAQNRIKWVAVGFFLAGSGSGALLLKIIGI